MTRMAACLGDDTIAAMLEGRLADGLAREARLHIGNCDACRELVSAAIGAPPSIGSTTRLGATSPHREELTPGRVFAGRYRIERTLGEGGMGLVLEARQLGLERRVAIKVLRAELARDEQALARFHREARLAASLDSRHVVRIYDLGVVETGEPYLVMELLDGEDLAAIVERGPVPVEQATRWIAAACEALGEAHGLGIVHRDIKPSNLFVTRGDRLVVLDFGLAKLTAAGNPFITREGMVLGSPRYMAPEQIRGARDVDGRADLWSLGATFYHLVTGRPPFPETSIDEVFSRILDGPPVSLHDVPPTLAGTLARVLARDPAQRFASANELALALRSRPADIDERFEIVELLGEGSHGTVYRARHRNGGREVALKLLRGDAHQIRERFVREAAIVQRLEHPNTVRLYESNVAGSGTPFMVFELVRGRTLAAELLRGPLLPARVARIATQVLKALLEAHAFGIVHRDITPSNILLVDFPGEPDFVKLLDFGVAADTEAPNLTMTGQTLGTPRYMAPEQVLGMRIDGRADLYALGLVLAEALAGVPVFGDTSAIATCMLQVAPEPVPLPRAVTTGPFGETIARATAKRVEDRFGSAIEMLQAIERGPRPLAAPLSPPPPPDVDVRHRSRSPVVALLVSSVAILGIATILLAWRPWATSDTSARTSAGRTTSASPQPERRLWGDDPLDASVAKLDEPGDTRAPRDAAASTTTTKTDRLDAMRLRGRLVELGWPNVRFTREQFPGCTHTRMPLDRGTFAGEPRGFGEVYLLECDSPAMASSEAQRLKRGFPSSWIVTDGSRLLSTSLPAPGGAFADENASRQLADALLAP